MLRSGDAVRDEYTPSDGTEFINGAKQLLGFIEAKAVKTINNLSAL